MKVFVIFLLLSWAVVGTYVLIHKNLIPAAPKSIQQEVIVHKDDCAPDQTMVQNAVSLVIGRILANKDFYVQHDGSSYHYHLEGITGPDNVTIVNSRVE